MKYAPILLALLLTSGTPLLWAQSQFLELCANGSPAEVTAALKAGASLSTRDQQGHTPLLVAATYNQDPKVITALLAAGSSIQESDSSGNSVLYSAVLNENPEVVSVVLAAGAPVNTRNEQGITPLMAAAEFNRNPIVIVRLIKAGAAVDTVDVDGWTALLYAAAYNPNPLVAHFLLRFGASVKAQDSKGQSSLMLAAQAFAASPEILLELWKAGADAQEKDLDGKSALDYARDNPGLAGTAVLKTLEEKPGADRSDQTEGTSPFGPNQPGSQEKAQP